MFGSKNRSKRDARRELIDSMPVDPNGDVTEDYLRGRHAARSARSRIADERSTARKVYPMRMPPEQAVSWVAHPGRYDVEGIDTRGKANVKRRERRPATPKAKTPAGKKAKPKYPKAKTPAKPKGPIPVKDSGVIVSGKEIVDITNIFNSTYCAPFPFGNDECAVDCKLSYGISLSRKDGKGMFGLDNDAVTGLILFDCYDMLRFDRGAIYKISLEDDKMVFRTGGDFSEIALVGSVGRMGGKPQTIEYYNGGRTPEQMFEFDSAAVTQALEKMEEGGVWVCGLESTRWGISLASDNEYFDFIIGPRMSGISGGSSYHVGSFHTVMKVLAPYVHSMGFCPGGPLVMKGEFGDYALTVAIRSFNSRRRRVVRNREQPQEWVSAPVSAVNGAEVAGVSPSAGRGG